MCVGFLFLFLSFSKLSYFFPAGKLNSETSRLTIHIQGIKCYTSILIQRVKCYLAACENKLKAKARYFMSSNVFEFLGCFRLHNARIQFILVLVTCCVFKLQL